MPKQTSFASKTRILPWKKRKKLIGITQGRILPETLMAPNGDQDDKPRGNPHILFFTDTVIALVDQVCVGDDRVPVITHD